MTASVLVIEDDPTVLMFLEEGLEERGFGVISARTSGEALHLLGNAMFPVDAMVADIRLGSGLDGWEIVRCAREIVPNMPVVYITGDSFGEFDAQGVADSKILQKPFTRFELAEAIEALLKRDVAPTA